MTAADKKIKHPYTFCRKSVGMLLLFYAIMMLRNTAFAASEAVTTIPSARRCSQPPPLAGEIQGNCKTLRLIILCICSAGNRKTDACYKK